METLGITLAEAKLLLKSVQNFIVAQQVEENLQQQRACQHCGERHTSKESPATRK